MFVKKFLGVVLMAALFIGCLLVPAGRWDWWMAWVFSAVRIVLGVWAMALIAARSPDTLEERFQPGEDAKGWDKVLSTSTLVMSFVVLVVAGLDKRFGWSRGLGLAFQLVMLAAWVCGDLFSKWAALTNPFYSRVVRIQADRGHKVISSGPYSFVRHPGYAGGLLAGMVTPLVLGSWWALVPAGVQAVLVVVRTTLEDRTLRTELDGYPEYAKQVKYRLIPKVW